MTLRQVRYLRGSLLLAASLGASAGCVGPPSSYVGAGPIFPADGDLDVGWQVDFRHPLPVSPATDWPLRWSAGAYRQEEAPGQVARVALSTYLPLVPRRYPGLFAEIGGGFAWSDDADHSFPVVGAVLMWAAPNEPWGFSLGYSWMPVDMSARDRRITDVGGFFAQVHLLVF